MDQVAGINWRSVFSLEEARALLPVVLRITKTYSHQVERLIERVDVLSASQSALTTKDLKVADLLQSLEAQINRLIQEWQAKIQKLGLVPQGLWIADFDAGDGYYCWKFPERTIQHWHRYSDGFSKRVSVTSKVKPLAIVSEVVNQQVPTSVKKTVFTFLRRPNSGKTSPLHLRRPEILE